MRMIFGRTRRVLAVLAACVVAVSGLAEEITPHPSRMQLKPVLKIRWRLFPDYPMGIQDSALGYLRGQVVSAGGFTRHPLDIENTVLVYDTISGQLGTADPLIERTSYPSSAIVGDTIYCLGGEGGPRLWHPATLQVGKIERLAQ